ncbi:MAG: 4Fe-4S cluster-binding domain-containing protein [Victivallales bacterium]|nr:4Fe-4S cluster-binding domain-containing protein [Victivallales bacterium]
MPMSSPYSHCTLCPRECGADRSNDELGFCGENAILKLGAILPHRGEEPCISGTKGSGTLFFTGCSCGCFFCQNHQLSAKHIGTPYDDETLYSAVMSLVEQGVHNLNFVTPEHWWPHIRKLCERLRKADVWLPFVWNSSGYFRVEMLKEQVELIDIFLPDFKYADARLAELCMGDSRYPDIALEGIRFLADKVGSLRPFDETGEITASRGLLIRHLVLPGYVENSLKVLELLAKTIGTDIPISVMSQFMPVPECTKRHLLERKVTEDEYKRVCDKINELGFRRGFIQYDNGEDGFLPDFTQKQPFAAMATTSSRP